MKLAVTYAKTGLARFISHRDLIRVIFRALSRARIPVEFSRGFNPHPRVEFCPPLGVGMEGWAEEFEARLKEALEPGAASELLNRFFPAGIRAHSALLREQDEPGLSRRLKGVRYLLRPGSLLLPSEEDLARFMARSEYPFTRLTAAGEKRLDLRRGLLRAVREQDGLGLDFDLSSGGRPRLVLAALCGKDEEELAGVPITRTGFIPEKTGVFTRNSPARKRK